MLGPSPPNLLIDSGSTGHYFAPSDTLTNVQPTDTPVVVQVANQQTMQSTHTAELPFHTLPAQARQVDIFPVMTKSLVAVSPLCDAGCTVTFDTTECTIHCPSGDIIHCPRRDDGLWALPATHQQLALTATSTPIAHSTPADLVAFAHAALFSPAVSTLTVALQKRFLPPFPGLTLATLRKYPPPLEATTMGHLDNRRKNIQSTKTPPIDDDPFPEQTPDNNRSNQCYLAAADLRHVVYTDQTGRLPQPSSSGNNYILVAYDYDSNAILLRPIRNRTAEALTAAMADIHTTLTKGGCRPHYHRLDNECPQQVKDYFTSRNVHYQLAPPNDHRSNAAERAIRTAKNHLAAGWASTDNNFPMYLWDKTLPQAELTLNLLRGSRLNPKLSAWEQLHGRYDFNAHPIAPPGTKVLAHLKPDQRTTWAPHAFEGWYIGPAFEHYRCFQVWATDTRQIRIVNQLTWFPQRPFPKLTSTDLLRATVEDLITILTNPDTDTYVGNLEDTQRGTLIQLSQILHQQPVLLGKKGRGHENPAPSLGVAPPEGPRRSPRMSQPPPRYEPGSYAAVNPDTGRHAEYRELSRSSAGPRWQLAMCKEIGRLFQGYTCVRDPTHSVQGTDTCAFIHKKDLPPGKVPTYVRIVSDYREQKADPYRVRCTVGGNLIDFPGDKSTKVADLVTVKTLLNKIVSTPNARAACIDIKDFYLNNPLPEAEYVRFHASVLPQEIWEQYNIADYVDDKGYVLARVDKGMYGLPQAGKVASDHLLPRLHAAGYKPTGRIPGLYKHDTNSIYFTLIVDDFLILHAQEGALDHLKSTLQQHYTITCDDAATKFCGMTLDWNYDEGHVTVSMPGYIESALQRFAHPPPEEPEHSPHAWIAPEYGASTQYAAPDDDSPPLSKDGITRLQQIIGTLLFYGRAVDNTMLVALGTVAAAQTQGTEKTMEAIVQLLNYAATHPDAAVRFHKNDMHLYIHSDASYLSEPKARSRVGGYFYLGNHDEPANNPQPNGPIHIESRIMKNVMAAASEAEIGALFHNGQEGSYMRQLLLELGHEQQQPTRITTDNSTADGFANQRTKLKRSKAMDMRFFWIQDRVQDGQFAVHWQQGEHNHADYFTKHHPTSHHIKMRPVYLHTSNLALLTDILPETEPEPEVTDPEVVPPECRGVLIRNPKPGYPDTVEPTQGMHDWPARARRVHFGSCPRYKQLPHRSS
jgi:Reverse transcriptase (RNA-dependent DNA polymerase)